MSELRDRLEALDQEIKSWAQLTRKKLLMRLATLNLQDRVRLEGERSLEKSLGYRLRRKGGEIEGIAFSFPRHGIFLEHGVGRGRPRGSGKALQYAKPWLKPVLDPETAELADALAEKYADLVAANLRILIPGIIDTTVAGGEDRYVETDVPSPTGGNTRILIDESFF